VNKSGNKAKGPKPNAPKPKNQITTGFDVRALSKRTAENIMSPMVNSDRVLAYMSAYMARRKINSVMFIVETTVLAV
jgi:hypothetical protein